MSSAAGRLLDGARVGADRGPGGTPRTGRAPARRDPAPPRTVDRAPRVNIRLQHLPQGCRILGREVHLIGRALQAERDRSPPPTQMSAPVRSSLSRTSTRCTTFLPSTLYAGAPGERSAWQLSCTPAMPARHPRAPAGAAPLCSTSRRAGGSPTRTAARRDRQSPTKTRNSVPCLLVERGDRRRSAARHVRCSSLTVGRLSLWTMRATAPTGTAPGLQTPVSPSSYAPGSPRSRPAQSTTTSLAQRAVSCWPAAASSSSMLTTPTPAAGATPSHASPSYSSRCATAITPTCHPTRCSGHAESRAALSRLHAAGARRLVKDRYGTPVGGYAIGVVDR